MGYPETTDPKKQPLCDKIFELSVVDACFEFRSV
ncbi:hypothetical protein SLEP1_g19098 [Rubroshorea leprosula]|nr:hypothetical protein SLEP1_g19098 [Rubroshorea leprosula]